MTPEVKQMYVRSIKDDEFLKEIWESDGDKKPGFFSSEMDKILFASIYYGWLVGKGRFNKENEAKKERQDFWKMQKGAMKYWGEKML